MTGLCGVLDDAAGLPQAPFQVDVLDGWQHGPSHVLGHLHHSLKGLAVVDRAIRMLGQDALDGAAVVFGEDPWWHAEFHQLP